MLSKSQDKSTHLKIVKILFWVILMFQAITSIFHFFLENSFYFWTGTGSLLWGPGLGSTLQVLKTVINTLLYYIYDLTRK